MHRPTLHFPVALIACAVLAACGGSGDSAPPLTVPHPSASVALALTSEEINRIVPAGVDIDIEISGNWTGTALASGPVYLNVRDPAGKFTTETKILSGATFTSTLRPVPSLPVGVHTGLLEVRACKDPLCVYVFPGSKGMSYSVTKAGTLDWSQHQGDANHRGFLPFTLDPAKFALAWKWQQPARVAPDAGINAVVTANNRVYVTTDVYFQQGTLFALSEANGSELWKRAFGEVPALNPPSVSNGRVYAAVSGHEASALWSFDAGTGSLLFSAPFSGQWPHLMAPTIYRDHIYLGAGEFGGETYSFSADTKARNWVNKGTGVWDMFGPAVDENHVYHYNGLALVQIDRKTGLTTATVADPFGKDATHSYHGTPVLGGRNNVIAFAGGAFSGSASANTEQYEQRLLSSFNLATMKHEWATTNAYLTTPAVAGGVIYAARNVPMSLDAIDEASGKVLWSWVPTGTENSAFHRNIIVTNNLLFVSTDSGVLALDLKTRTQVWRHPQPGMLAISGDRTLYIATGARQSDGGLVAIKLQ